MKNASLFVSIVFACVFVSQPLIGQSIHGSTPKKPIPGVIISHDSIVVDKEELKLIKKSHFDGGISYLNNDVYLGRKDSSLLPYYIPVLSYYHKSGLYFS